MDGVSLARMMSPGGTGMQLEAYAESMYPERFGWSRLQSLRGDRYKLVDAPRPELYDLQTDSFEQHNVYQENPRIAGLLRQQLARFGAPAPEGHRPSPAVVTRPCHPPAGARVCGITHAPSTARAGEAWPDPKDTIREYNALVQQRLELSAGAGQSEPVGCPSGTH